MNVHSKEIQRAAGLLVCLGVLAAVLAVRGIVGSLPHEPRLYIHNDSMGPLRDTVVHSKCGDLALPALADGETARLDLIPRTGCVYEIHGTALHGDYLLYLLDLARDRRASVEITIGLDFVEADLTSSSVTW